MGSSDAVALESRISYWRAVSVWLRLGETVERGL